MKKPCCAFCFTQEWHNGLDGSHRIASTGRSRVKDDATDSALDADSIVE
jgi:hypothetical protein